VIDGISAPDDGCPPASPTSGGAVEAIQALYERKYANEEWVPIALKPHALSTRHWDDTARLLARERGTLLDVSCGGGQLLVALAEDAVRFTSLAGIDLSHTRVTAALRELAARPALEGRVSIELGNADHPLPFPDASFDVVVCSAVLEHVVDVFGCMDELARVCRSGGCLILTVPNICYIKHLISLLRGQVPATAAPTHDLAVWRWNGWDGGHLHYFSPSAVDNLLRDTGFAPEEWTGDGRWAKLRRWNRRFVGNITVRARRVRL